MLPLHTHGTPSLYCHVYTFAFYVSLGDAASLMTLTLTHLGIQAGRYCYGEDLRLLGHPPESPLTPASLWPPCPSPIAPQY